MECQNRVKRVLWVGIIAHRGESQHYTRSDIEIIQKITQKLYIARQKFANFSGKDKTKLNT